MPLQPKSEVAFKEESLAVLRIEADGGTSLSSVTQFLSAIDKIHRRFQALDTVFILVKQGSTLPTSSFYGSNLDRLIEKAELGLSLPRLHAAEFHSPGFWEIIGSLSPLKFISDCLTHWREYRKDKEFRDEAEAGKLLLENQLRTNEVLKQRVDLLRSIGVSDADLQRVFFEPLAAQTTSLLVASQSSLVSSEAILIQVSDSSSEAGG